MPTYTKTPSNRWKAIIRQNNKVVRTKTFDRKTDAKTWARNFELKLGEADAHGLPALHMTLKELIKEYDDNWTGVHEARYKSSFWDEALGSERLIDITPMKIQPHLDLYARGYARRGNGFNISGHKSKATKRKRSPASINRMRANLSSIFRYAIKKHYLNENPVRTVATLTENNKRCRYLSDDERKALLEACDKSEWPKLRLLVVLAITTGARLGEMMNLRWNEIDFQNRTALLKMTKNGEPRVLTFPTPAINELKKHREVSSRLVFASEIKPDKPFHFRKHWDKVLITAEIENFRFHDLRHTAASYLAMSGATLFEVAQVLGHKSTATTERYAHLSVQHKADLAERVMSEKMGDL